jgi:hypothetical protein
MGTKVTGNEIRAEQNVNLYHSLMGMGNPKARRGERFQDACRTLLASAARSRALRVT